MPPAQKPLDGVYHTAIETLIRENMSPGRGPLLAAVSGGVDSMVMLHILSRYAEEAPLDLRVIHIDHGLRGEESTGDAQHVQSIASTLGTPCHVEHLNLTARSATGQANTSVESLWRDARFEAIRCHAHAIGAGVVAVGHTRDDLAETVLMRLIRGAGLAGLAAFGPVTIRETFRIVRPLYDLSRSQIIEWACAHGIHWREDASNRDRDRLRNRVRLDLIPHLESTFNPSIRDALFRAAETARTDDAYMETVAKSIADQWDFTPHAPPHTISLRDLKELHPAILRRVLRNWLTDLTGESYPPSYNEIGQLMDLIHHKPTGKQVVWRRRWRFIRLRRHIRTEPID